MTSAQYMVFGKKVRSSMAVKFAVSGNGIVFGGALSPKPDLFRYVRRLEFAILNSTVLKRMTGVACNRIEESSREMATIKMASSVSVEPCGPLPDHVCYNDWC